MDPTGVDDTARWLAYVHPTWMVVSLTLALLALRAGLNMRWYRRERDRSARKWRKWHLRLAKPAVAMIAIGFVAGPLSMWWFRDRAPFGTAHALLGVVAAGFFLYAGYLGRRIEEKKSRAREMHARMGLIGILVGAAAAVAGFVLLP